MAYSSITNPGDYFNTVLYTGNGGTQSITGVGFQPDYVWLKERASDAVDHKNVDSVRGANKKLESNTNEVEGTATTTVTSFDCDGFSLGSSGATNGSSDTYVSWNWLAGGTAPTQTYTVKVVSDSGNKYRFDDFGTSAVTLDLQEGGTYTFDQSDSSNSGHPLRFSTTSDGTHGGGSEYTTNVTTTGTPGSSGAQTVITVAASAPTLYYYCTQHSGMGGQANTNSLFGSSNFAGSYQSLVSANTTAGFSIVTYSGTGSNATVGHGLGVAPSWIMVKEKTGSVNDWAVYAKAIGIGMSSPDPETDYLILNENNARADSNTVWNDTAPTSSVFSIGTGSTTNRSGSTYVAYCFSDVKGYSKFGGYTGNGNANGTFIYTGFKPAWIMVKVTNDGDNWHIIDNKRNPFNAMDSHLFANLNTVETTTSSYNFDMLSNGFKPRSTNNAFNASTKPYVYMAFAENPFVANDSGTVVPSTAG